MKYILFIFVSVFIAVSCIDDKTNLDYKEINEYENWKIEGIDGSYSLFPGESVVLTPKVRFYRLIESGLELLLVVGWKRGVYRSFLYIYGRCVWGL